jgi:RHS repeat-associated protein
MNKRAVVSIIGFVLLLVSGSIFHGRTFPRVAPERRPGESQTLLPDGQWLLLGGEDHQGIATGEARVLDPKVGVSRSVGSMQFARASHTATVLPDGTVLVLGGIDETRVFVDQSEIFHPETGNFEVIAGPSPRAFHTATIATDGRVVIVGGISSDGAILDAIEYWDSRTRKTKDATASLNVPRWSHTAELTADGQILITAGKSADQQAVSAVELFDPVRETIRTAVGDNAPKDSGPIRIDVLPEDNALAVPIDTLIAIRFSHPVLVTSLSSETLTLTGPSGKLEARVVGAEGGKLAFVNPKSPLEAATRYTVEVRGVATADGQQVRAWMSIFTTADLAKKSDRTSSDADSLRSLPPLQAPPGVTALSGQVLTVSGAPLQGVSLSIEDHQARTDGTGRFLLSGVPPGHQVLLVDGSGGGNSSFKDSYGIYEIGVDVMQDSTTVLNHTIWLTPIDKAHAVAIPSPTSHETVITTPLIPGLELHLPAGTVITDHWHKTVREISITPIPVERPPLPLPSGTPLFFTIQPGAAYVQAPKGAGARLIYPNVAHAAPNSFVPFWTYDPVGRGWYVYGQGRVTADGKQVIPNPGVEIYEFVGAMINFPAGQPRPSGPLPGGAPSSGDPVDPATGTFVYTKTDLFLDDVIPIQVTRTYMNNDSNLREFGIGMLSTYGIFLSSTNQYQVADLNMPNAQYHFVRTSPGFGFADAVFAHTSSPTPFYGSQLAWNGDGWDLTLKNGEQYVFGENAPLQAVKDRYGNQVTLTRTFNSTSGNIVQVSSPNGRFINFTYNANNLITRISDSSGRMVSYAYDTSNRLIQVTDANGGITQYTYDSNNRMLTVQDARNIVYLRNEYDASGRVARQTLADGSSFEFSYTVGADGKITQTDITDPRGTVRRVVFDTNSYPISDTYALGSPEQKTITYTRDPATNLPLSVTDALSRRTDYTYDAMGNVTSITRLAGTPNALTWSMTYDPVFNRVTQVTDPLTHTNTLTYDARGGLATWKDGLQNAWSYTHDTQGRLTSVSDPLSNRTQFVYDATGLVSVMDPLNDIARQVNDWTGRRSSVSDPLGNQTFFAYDNLNNLTAITDAQSNLTIFSYDPNGNVVGIIDPRNGPTSYVYDNMDRVISHRDPLNNQESYQYDPVGNAVQSTDRGGKVITYAYDRLNRLTFVGYDTRPGPVYESTITYTYDAGDRLISATDSLSGTITRSYDGLDRLLSEATPQGTVTYAYDNADRPAMMTVAGQPAVSYTYDNADRLTRITQGATSISFAYDAGGRRTSMTLPGSIVGAYTYDKNSRLTSITYNVGSTTLGDVTYTYDAAGWEVGRGGSLARINLPNPVSTTAYNANNQLTNWAGATLSYDANGNLTSDGTNTYVWNARNQLVFLNSGVSTFQYDAFGRRISKSFAGTTTSFLYDGANPVQELQGSTVMSNLLSGGLDELFLRTDSTGPRTFLTDRLGSTLALADSSGAIQSQYTYEPFGRPSTSGQSSTNSFEFTGREFDATGLFYYRARYYNPMLGRFISEDPIGFAGGDSNLYSYVFDDPINTTDPTGEIAPWLPACLGGAAFDAGWQLASNSLSGRKSVWAGIGGAAVSGCASGLVGFGAGKALGLAAKAVGGATVRAGKVVIGENMFRVREYAQQIGAEVFEGIGMEANRVWIRAARQEGKAIIDVGPDFGRRLERYLQGVPPDSSFYNMERMEAGEAVRSIFKRLGRFQGGVPGLDF